jgi:hypothetical protein
LLDVPEVAIVSREHDEPLPGPHLGNLVEVRQQLPVVHGTRWLAPTGVRPQILDLDREVVRLAYPKVDTGCVAASRTLEDGVSRRKRPRHLQAQGEAEMDRVFGCGKPGRIGLRLKLLRECVKT